MRFTTSGELRRLDLSPMIELLPPLREEWAGLEFDRNGHLLNPVTREPTAACALLEGRHRQPGARYRATITTPAYDIPEERRDASVRVGSSELELELTLTLRDDSSRRLAFAVTDETEHWTVDVDLEHGRLPKVEISGTVDLTARLRADGTPGCLSGIFGGTGAGAATVDLAAIERDGSLIVAEGRANRFRGNGRVDVRPSATTWGVTASGALRALGLARPILWIAGGRIRRSIDESLAEFWPDGESHISDLDREVQRLRAAIAEEGGAAPFVRRALWDKDFDPGLDFVRPSP